MAELFTNIVSYTAAVVGTSLMLPQIIKSWGTKKMEDVSFGMIILYFFNCLLWLIYGILITAWPAVLANGIALVISIFQIVLKMKYKQKAV